MREETFGPVLAIRVVASADEAVNLANDSPFALSASVWTHDIARAKEVASQLRAGAVMINDVASYYGIAEAPHGGPRRKRMGPHSLALRLHGNGARKVRGCRSLAWPLQCLVVWLRRRTCEGSRQVHSAVICARLEATRYGPEGYSSLAHAPFASKSHLTFIDCGSGQYQRAKGTLGGLATCQP